MGGAANATWRRTASSRIGWRQQPERRSALADAYLDRIERTVERDKNHPSIIMWSLGNECRHRANLAAMADWVHGPGPGRPVHYEGDSDRGYVDVYSRMYADHTPRSQRSARASNRYRRPALDAHRRGMPFVLCEYAHAMGNGPGGLRNISSSSNSIRGCWVASSGSGSTMASGSGRPTVASTSATAADFGEEYSDGNFITDGLVFPDRTPSPGLIEFAKVFEPVTITVGRRGMTLTNGYDFADTSHLDFSGRSSGTAWW